MDKIEKELLLKDLCARLPYYTWVQYEGEEWLMTGYGHGRVSLLTSMFSSAVGPCPLIVDVKPYLRPMSSMTEEEKKEFDKVLKSCNDKVFACPDKERRYNFFDAEQEDFMNAHHLDYRGLISKGLALEAPKDMYKTE